MVNYKNVSDKQLIEKINNLKTESKRALDCLAKLEAELEKRKQEVPLGVPFIPKNEEDYWLIESRGFPFFTRNKDSFDVATTKFLNAFNSKESAEKHSEMLLDWRKDGLLANANCEPIDIKVLLPLLKKGWVFYQGNINAWLWSKNKPTLTNIRWEYEAEFYPIHAFNIKPAKDWRKSLMECGL